MNPPLPEMSAGSGTNYRPRSPAPLTPIDGGSLRQPRSPIDSSSLRPRSPAPIAPIDGNHVLRPRSPAPLAPIDGLHQIRPRSPAPHTVDHPISPEQDRLGTNQRSRSPVTAPPMHVFHSLLATVDAATPEPLHVRHEDGTINHLPPLPQINLDKKSTEAHTSIDSFRKNVMSFKAEEAKGGHEREVETSSSLLLSSIKTSPDKSQQTSSIIAEARKIRKSFTDEEASSIQGHGIGGRNNDVTPSQSSPEQRRFGLGQLPHLESQLSAQHLASSSNSCINGNNNNNSEWKETHHRHAPTHLEHLDHAATLTTLRGRHSTEVLIDKRHLHDSLSESKVNSRPSSASNTEQRTILPEDKEDK